jgi:26S proteasome regulatory subunit N10
MGDGSGVGVGGGDAFAEYGGVDPSMDPELAMALRVSMEEERARQERVAAAATAAAANESKENEGGDATSGEDRMEVAAVDAGHGNNMDELTDEDALLQQALAMSMAENEAVTSSENVGRNEDTVMNTGDDDEEDAAMQMALQMSMQGEEGYNTAAPGQFQDPAFVSNVSDCGT